MMTTWHVYNMEYGAAPGTPRTAPPAAGAPVTAPARGHSQPRRWHQRVAG